MPWDLVATDLDGTIVTREATVSPRVRAALAGVEEAGCRLVLVTGRPTRWMAGIADATGHRGIAICANGAVVYDLHREEILESFLLQPADSLEVVEALRREVPGVAFAVEGTDRFGREEAYQTRFANPDVVLGPVEELASAPLAKLLVQHTEMTADELLAVLTPVVAGRAELTHASRSGLVELSARGVSKASGLARYAKEHGLAAQRALAFGDMPNDLPMLAWAGRSVAVGNAHPEVLAAVDEVTGPIEEDGVAQVLEREFGLPGAGGPTYR